MDESWRPVVGHEGFYEVSDLGRIRSLPRQTPTGIRGGGLKKVQRRKAGGYPAVELWRDGVQTGRTVHSLMMEAFTGPRPPGMQVRHLDGDPANNVLSNLAYGSGSENNHDQVIHGTHPEASKTHCPQGHPYDDANTYVFYVGASRRRSCRTCHNETCRRYYARKKKNS